MEGATLTETELERIRSVLRRHRSVTGGLLFGSRAKGTAAPSSDIDLALIGISDPLVAESIRSELDELPLPYKFDVKAFDSLPAGALREHIERVGVKIFP